MPDTIDGSQLVDELTYCLEQGYPANITEALLRVCEDRDYMSDAAEEWRRWARTWPALTTQPVASIEDFSIAVYELTCEDVKRCYCCDEWTWESDLNDVAIRGRYGTSVCSSCYDEYCSCSSCGYNAHQDDIVGIHDGNIDICRVCLDTDYVYCEHCADYFYRHDFAEHESEMHGGCDCEPSHTQFHFPNNGNEPVNNETVFTVELPGGVISDVGKEAILGVLYSDYSLYRRAERLFDEIGMEWQTRRGNFTRRLSSALYKQGLKIPGEMLTEIGNVARQHSTNGSSWKVQLSREYLNESPGYWYNDDSCWWGSESASRCAFKSWGGIGMRTVMPDTYEQWRACGRAWIQPINDDGTPTHHIDTASAFVVYNGYGDLEGYHGARIVAYLTGNTYRKIILRCENQYINGCKGYLVANEEMCQRVDVIEWSHGVHERR